MIKTRFLLVITTILFILSSCSKDEFKTDGELIGEKVQQLVDSENLSIATTYLVEFFGNGTVYWRDEKEVGFSIEGQIIKVRKSYYNLSRLVKFQVDYNNVSSKKIHSLYFEGYQ